MSKPQSKHIVITRDDGDTIEAQLIATPRPDEWSATVTACSPSAEKYDVHAGDKSLVTEAEMRSIEPYITYAYSLNLKFF